MIDNSNKLIKLFSGNANMVFLVLNLLENLIQSNGRIAYH